MKTFVEYLYGPNQSRYEISVEGAVRELLDGSVDNKSGIEADVGRLRAYLCSLTDKLIAKGLLTHEELHEICGYRFQTKFPIEDHREGY